MKRHLAPYALASCLAAMATPAAAQEQAPPPVKVATEEIRMADFAPKAWAPGTVAPRFDADIPAEVAGRVTHIQEVGERVEAGEAIARIDDARLRLAVDEQRADVERLEALLVLAEKTLARQEELAERGASSLSGRDQAQADLATARAALNQARAVAGRLERDLADAVIRAPFAGQIVERMVTVGEYAREVDPVARLVDTERKEVTARAPLATARYLEAGGLIVLETQDGERYDASVRAIAETGDAAARVVEIRAALPTTRRWIAGEAVSLGAPTAPARVAMAAPRDSLVLRQDGAFVFVVDTEGKARRVEVATGAGSGSLIEIQGDVQIGDSVVVRGAERLRDGQAVEAARGVT